MGDDAVDEIVRNCLAVRSRLIARSVTGIFDDALDGHGVTIAQVNLMAALGATGPCPPSTLGEVLELERSTVSRNVNLLVRHGWAEPLSSDARGVRELALTAAGRGKLESIMPAWREAQARAAQLLGPSGVTAIREMASAMSELPGP